MMTCSGFEIPLNLAEHWTGRKTPLLNIEITQYGLA